MLSIEEICQGTDLEELVGLLNKDPIPGQPPITAEMIDATLLRLAQVDSGFYEQLIDSHIVIARDEAGALVGAAAFGTTVDGIRDLLWAFASGGVHIYEALVNRSFDGWDGPARACWYATTISAGLEGLPRTLRGDLHDVLVAAGFEGQDLWSYQMLELEEVAACPLAFSAEHVKAIVIDGEGAAVAEYEVSTPFEGIGVVWWIQTYETFRGRGFGTAALHQALDELRRRGVPQAVLYIDDDEDESPRDRRPAKRLYARCGFREVDRLWSYSRGVMPEDS